MPNVNMSSFLLHMDKTSAECAIQQSPEVVFIYSPQNTDIAFFTSAFIAAVASFAASWNCP